MFWLRGTRSAKMGRYFHLLLLSQIMNTRRNWSSLQDPGIILSPYMNQMFIKSNFNFQSNFQAKLAFTNAF